MWQSTIKMQWNQVKRWKIMHIMILWLKTIFSANQVKTVMQLILDCWKDTSISNIWDRDWEISSDCGKKLINKKKCKQKEAIMMAISKYVKQNNSFISTVHCHFLLSLPFSLSSFELFNSLKFSWYLIWDMNNWFYIKLACFETIQKFPIQLWT